MAKIRNYNPNLGLRLNDLKMLLGLSYYQANNVIDAVCKSVEGDCTYTFGNQQSQFVYDLMMKSVNNNVESYDRYLIEKLGYTREDIEQYHKENYTIIDD